MYNTLALFAVFALFTTGSATDGCGGGDDGKICKKAEGGTDFIGTCASSACSVKMCSSPDTQHSPCGDNSKDFSGNCLSATGRCQHTTFVNVEYSAQAVRADVEAVAGTIDNNVFKSNFVGSMSRYSKNAARDCTAKDFTHTDTRNKTACKDNTRGGCPVVCAAGFVKTTASDYACTYNNTDSRWDWAGAQKGVCTKRCPTTVSATGSFVANGLGGTETEGVVTFTDRVRNGKYECTDVLAGNKKCTLICDDGFRAPLTAALGDFGCKANDSSGTDDFPEWKGAVGVCTASVKIEGSVHISLKNGETVVALQANGEFTTKFQVALANEVTGLSAHHVSITSIGPVSRRRLSEQSVQVDYTILDPESATELGKVDGGGLRGIR